MGTIARKIPTLKEQLLSTRESDTHFLDLLPAYKKHQITAWNDKAAALRRLGQETEEEFCAEKVIELGCNCESSLVL